MLILPESELNKNIACLRLDVNPKLIKAIAITESGVGKSATGESLLNLQAYKYEVGIDRKNKDKWKKHPYKDYAYLGNSTSIYRYLRIHGRANEIQLGDFSKPANWWLAGSHGWMQILGCTALEMGFYKDEPEIYDPFQNLYYGTLYLLKQLDRYNGAKEEAVAAYNAGTAIKNNNGLFINQLYVDRVLKLYQS